MSPYAEINRCQETLLPWRPGALAGEAPGSQLRPRFPLPLPLPPLKSLSKFFIKFSWRMLSRFCYSLSCLGNLVKCNNKMKLSVANHRLIYNSYRVLTGFVHVVIFDSKPAGGGGTMFVHFGSIGKKRAPFNFLAFSSPHGWCLHESY